jgi:hypothetical protein
MSMLYLARPIDLHDPLADRWTPRVVEAIRLHQTNARFGIYNPLNAFVLGTMAKTNQVRLINNYALEACDGLLAVWPAKAKSWGVPAEVERAVIAGKPTVVIAQGPATWSMVDPGIQVLTPGKDEDIDLAVRQAVQFFKLEFDKGEG